jgi:DNA-binding SARP family transcriptional activator
LLRSGFGRSRGVRTYVCLAVGEQCETCHERRPVDWELRLVGPVEVREVAGERLSWDLGSRKARTLLAFLGIHNASTMAVDLIVEALWDGRRPRRPEAGVATLVSRLRARLGPRAIDGGHTGYRLGETVMVDLHEAAELVTEAETLLRQGEPSSSAVAAERGLGLLRGGPVLADQPASRWAVQARDLETKLLRRAWLALAEAALRMGEPERTRPLAENAIAADPLDEAAYRMLMRACFAAGEPAHAIMAYQHLHRTLAVELGTDPAPATQALYLAVLDERNT